MISLYKYGRGFHATSLSLNYGSSNILLRCIPRVNTLDTRNLDFYRLMFAGWMFTVANYFHAQWDIEI